GGRGARMVLDALQMEPEYRVGWLQERMNQGQVAIAGEAGLGLARALIDNGMHADAEACLSEVEMNDGSDWRVSWYRGLSLLAQGRYPEAQVMFDRLYSDLCGELAPQLGLAQSADQAHD